MLISYISTFALTIGILYRLGMIHAHMRDEDDKSKIWAFIIGSFLLVMSHKIIRLRSNLSMYT